MDLRGNFCGTVEDNKDPEKLGRLKVRVPHVFGAVGGAFGSVATNDLPWALPAGLPNGLSQTGGGADWLPDIGDQLIVLFLDNEPEKPVWMWFMQTQAAVEKFPLHVYNTGANGSVGTPKRGAWVRYGHTVEWNADGLILTTSKGYRLLLTDASSAGNDGDISLSTQAGQTMELDDSTGDGTVNINNDWNINVTKQILAIADSFSLTTMNHEIELISGAELTIDTTKNLEGTVGKDWTMDVTGKSTFTLSDTWTANAVKDFALNATTDFTLSAKGNGNITTQNQLNVSSTGVMSVKSAVAMNFDFLQLTLGTGATSPFVKGDQLFTYLQSLFAILVAHTHSGVLSGPSSTGTMLPPPQPPTAALLSTVILGK